MSSAILGPRRRVSESEWDFPGVREYPPKTQRPPAASIPGAGTLLPPGCPGSCSWSYSSTDTQTKPLSAQNTPLAHGPPAGADTAQTNRSRRGALGFPSTSPSTNRPPHPAGAHAAAGSTRARTRRRHLGPYRHTSGEHAREGTHPANAFTGASPAFLIARAAMRLETGAPATRVRLVSFQPPVLAH